jgi:hypothetical protein
MPAMAIVVTCSLLLEPVLAQEAAPNVRLFEWERGFAIQSDKQKDMAVYLWFYEWHMFDAMQRGQHTNGSYQLERKLTDDGQQGVISSPALTIQMTAVTDGATLMLTVRNNTDYDFPTLAAIIPCFNPGPQATRNRQFANTNTYFLGPSGLQRLMQREIHFNAGLRDLVNREARDGRYAWSDKWPLAEPNAVEGLIVRESTDGRWACGIAWDDFLSAQGHNPWECMHLSVRVGPLERGKSKEVRGRIYLLLGNREDVLSRHRNNVNRKAP